jgi:hypothetical protein
MEPKEPWEILGISFNDWFYGPYDKGWYWREMANKKTIDSYLWRKENYEKGKQNEHILKSVFGKSSETEILKEINWWFDKCVGANTTIYI